MKKRFWLWERNGVFYLDDSVTRKKISLHTRDSKEAERIRDARNEAEARPTLSVQLAKAYLSAHDAESGKRTWQDVIDRYCSIGKEVTQRDRRRVSNRKPQCYLKTKKLLETTADDLLEILEEGGVMTNCFVRGLHNLAVGVGWLPMPILAPKMWPKVTTKLKRGITADEQEKIISTENNKERKLYYQLLWEIGAAQSDGASLTNENINWKERTLSYQRQKTGTWSHTKIGERLENLLRQLPKQGMLFPKWGATNANARAAEFRRRCRILELEGISLHSYRYAWAERAKAAGYPERYAQEALGHGSKAWARAYSKGAHVVLPPLEDYENKIIELHSQNGKRKIGMGV
ncbi:MAG TPA: tyrosine-type recombinase/integrase [Verrucomicrobiae bacterium]|nr:tyrosine-type recombinase/integrase [Verrucomicrobiae bacterium]